MQSVDRAPWDDARTPMHDRDMEERMRLDLAELAGVRRKGRRLQPRLYAGRTEVVTHPGGAGGHAYCPQRGVVVPLRECLRCRQFSGLAMDQSGEHWYAVCARAEVDRLAVEAWLDEGDDGGAIRV